MREIELREENFKRKCMRRELLSLLKSIMSERFRIRKQLILRRFRILDRTFNERLTMRMMIMLIITMMPFALYF
jgi:hypothetical protein